MNVIYISCVLLLFNHKSEVILGKYMKIIKKKTVSMLDFVLPCDKHDHMTMSHAQMNYTYGHMEITK